MTITIQAVYANGAFLPERPVELAEGTSVQLTVNTVDQRDDPDDPFEAVIGTCDGPSDVAANHDKYLYGDGRS